MNIYDLFLPLHRAGPGDAASLRWAVGLAGTAPGARVLDAGCGLGADLADLAMAVPGARITALDAAEAFVEQIRQRAPEVHAVVGDMANPPGGPYDLIWSAGAVYNLGIGPALSAWRGVLAPGGRVAFSDLCKTRDPLPVGAAAYWATEGLTLRDADAMDAEIDAAGWRRLGARWIGPAGWAAYYEPLAQRLDGFDGDPDLIAAFRAEIACWRQWGDSFDYRLCVVEPA